MNFLYDDHKWGIRGTVLQSTIFRPKQNMPGVETCFGSKRYFDLRACALIITVFNLFVLMFDRFCDASQWNIVVILPSFVWKYLALCWSTSQSFVWLHIPKMAMCNVIYEEYVCAILVVHSIGNYWFTFMDKYGSKMLIWWSWHLILGAKWSGSSRVCPN